jgi:hypothetical protein
MLLLLAYIEKKLDGIYALLVLVNFSLLAKSLKVRAMPFLNKMQCFLVDIQSDLNFEIFVPTAIFIKVLLIVGFESFNEFLVFFLSLSECLFKVLAHALSFLHSSKRGKFIFSFDSLCLKQFDFPFILNLPISLNLSKMVYQLFHL